MPYFLVPCSFSMTGDVSKLQSNIPGPADVERFRVSPSRPSPYASIRHRSLAFLPPHIVPRARLDRNSRPTSSRPLTPLSSPDQSAARHPAQEGDDSHLTRPRPAATRRTYPHVHRVASSSSRRPTGEAYGALGRPDGMPGKALGSPPAS